MFLLLSGDKVHFIAPCEAKTITFSTASVEKKSLFYSCDCCPRFAWASNLTRKIIFFYPICTIYYCLYEQSEVNFYIFMAKAIKLELSDKNLDKAQFLQK